MGYEIDFLAVGKGAHGGDAIAIRFGDLKGDCDGDIFTMVVDGGYGSNGLALVELITATYQTDTVDLVISTHPDNDHIQGLEHVVRSLNVKELWIHETTLDDQESIENSAIEAGQNGSARFEGVAASLQQAQSLRDVADERGITIRSPFQGTTSAGGRVTVLGPSRAYYRELLPLFRTTAPKPLKEMVAGALHLEPGAEYETMDHETLPSNGNTEAENNASVITLINLDKDAILLTADAGEGALNQAADHLDLLEFNYESLTVVQIPHHGAVCNVTPAILNRLFGQPVQAPGGRRAVVSCPKNGTRGHPSKRVTNAFHRRGFKVYQTAGRSIRLGKDAPERGGYGPASAVPFFTDVS